MRRKSARELRGRMLEHIKIYQELGMMINLILAEELAWAMNSDVPTIMLCGFCRGKIPLVFGQSKCPECGRDLDIIIRDYNIANFRRAENNQEG